MDLLRLVLCARFALDLPVRLRLAMWCSSFLDLLRLLSGADSKCWLGSCVGENALNDRENASNGAEFAGSSVEPGYQRPVWSHRRRHLSGVSPLAGSRRLRAGRVLGRHAKRRAGAEAVLSFLIILLPRSIHARVMSCALIVSMLSCTSNSHRIHRYLSHIVHLHIPCMMCMLHDVCRIHRIRWEMGLYEDGVSAYLGKQSR